MAPQSGQTEGSARIIIVHVLLMPVISYNTMTLMYILQMYTVYIIKTFVPDCNVYIFHTCVYILKRFLRFSIIGATTIYRNTGY